MKLIRSRTLILAVSVVVLALVTLFSLVLFNQQRHQSHSETESVQESQIDVGTSEAIAVNDAQNSSADTKTREAWSETNVEDVQPSLVPKYKEEVEGASLVQLAQDMQLWRQDDQLVIAVPQTQEQFLVTIAEVSTTLGTNRTYKGKIVEEESSYSFLITVGERNVFANFTTSEGSFELVGNNKYAWLMPTENMDQHVDYTKDDFFIPEIEHGSL
ncbi:MAG: hypothetical protein F4X44_01105 [Gammaproteobacteria bacterium]|nr:hypothetical protein [Gammaproteobacteria bacterium]MYD79201.1 hypothetical protein [Gammaproteobacteria bacterium]